MKHIYSIFALLLLGCSSSEFDVQPVSGTITYKGVPIEDAQISFVAVSSGTQGASGMSGSGGIYSLASPGASTAGAMGGEYNVFITKTILVDAAGKPLPKKEITPIESGRPDLEGGSYGRDNSRMKSVLPAKYNDTAAPILKAVVKRGKNVCNFDLEE